MFLAIDFGEEKLLTFLVAKYDKRNTWWLPSVFVKGYWAHTCLVATKHFSTQILGVEMPNNHQVFLCRDLGIKTFNSCYVLLRKDIKCRNPWCFCIVILGAKTFGDC